MLAASPLFQIAAWLLSVFAVWMFAPDWLGITNHPLAALLSWVAGSALFLIVLAFVYSVECLFRPGGAE